jgi:alpha-galactosidase/6-phospho-beta-glucosidase family protein
VQGGGSDRLEVNVDNVVDVRGIAARHGYRNRQVGVQTAGENHLIPLLQPRFAEKVWCNGREIVKSLLKKIFTASSNSRQAHQSGKKSTADGDGQVVVVGVGETI